MNSWSTGTKKKEKKGTKSKGIIEVPEPVAEVVVVPEPVQEKAAEDDIWSSWGSAGKKYVCEDHLRD